MWPKPTGAVNLKNVMAKIDVNSVTISASNYKDQTRFWDENRDRLLKQIKSKLPRKVQVDGGKSVRIDILVESNDSVLTMNTNESYKIVGVDRSDAVDVKIESPSIFGARHALETLSQLVVFDDIRRELQVSHQAHHRSLANFNVSMICRLLPNSTLPTNPFSNIVDCFWIRPVISFPLNQLSVQLVY